MSRFGPKTKNPVDGPFTGGPDGPDGPDEKTRLLCFGGGGRAHYAVLVKGMKSACEKIWHDGAAVQPYSV